MKGIIKKTAIVIIISLLIGGNVMAAELMSPEELMALAGLSSEEISEEELQKIIQTYNLSEENIAEVSEDGVSEMLLAMKESISADNYLYLFGDNINDMGVPSLDQVKNIAILQVNEKLNQSLLLDLENLKCYYDPAKNIFNNVNEAEKISDLDDNSLDLLGEIFQKADWEAWDNSYQGDTKASNYECMLAIETDEGLLRYTISGIDSDVPVTLTDFTSSILHAFWDDEIK